MQRQIDGNQESENDQEQPKAPTVRASFGETPWTTPPQSLGLSVTPQAQNSNLVGWRSLACGVDSLYLGIYVQWGESWKDQIEELAEWKEEASGTQGVPMNDGKFLILPGGKQNFCFHLQWPEFHLFLSDSQEPKGGTPNAYAEINAKTLWQTSIEASVAIVLQEIEAFGGTVLNVKPSRCDLAADFYLPNPLSLDFILSHRVPSDGQHSHNMTANRLETLYQGSKKSPVQIRIYDKALEVLKGGTKLWFLDVWKIPECEDVWRVEFQLRRPFLKARRINTVSELIDDLGSLWKYLTEDWFSLRFRDDPNATRRTVHPWWLGVQMCDQLFGVPRVFSGEADERPADVEWYIAHCSGCLASFAARLRVGNFEGAAEELVNRMRLYWSRNDFGDRYAVKSIQLGFAGSSEDRVSDGQVMEDAA